MRKTLAAVLAGLAFVVGGFFAGTYITNDAAVAQEEPAAEAPAEPGRFGPRAEHKRGPGQLLGAAAEYLDITPEELVEYLRDGGVIAELDGYDGMAAALVADAEERIDAAVADGKLTEEQAAEIKAELEAKITEFLTTEHEPRERPNGDRGDHHVRKFVKEAADVIGIEVEVLVEGLESGMSIAEVAEANGMSEGNLVAHLTNIARERIEDAVNKTRS